jgi:hypothetical protein
VRIHRREQE